MPSLKETEFEILTRQYSQTKNFNPENIDNLILLFIDKNESYEKSYTLKHKDDFINNYNNYLNTLLSLRNFEIDKKIATIKKMLRILYSLYCFTNEKYEYCDDLYNVFLVLSDLYQKIGYNDSSINNINLVTGAYYVGCYFKHQKIKNYF